MKKSWERKECEGCKSYSPECQQWACSICSYKKKIVNERDKHDTS